MLQGLGEMMPEQLWSTTLNPATRTLRKLTVDDAGGRAGWGLCVGKGSWVVWHRSNSSACAFRLAPPPTHTTLPACPAPACLPACPLAAAAEASHMFALLMGDKVGPRRELIERHGSRLALAELDI